MHIAGPNQEIASLGPQRRICPGTKRDSDLPMPSRDTLQHGNMPCAMKWCLTERNAKPIAEVTAVGAPGEGSLGDMKLTHNLPGRQVAVGRSSAQTRRTGPKLKAQTDDLQLPE